MDLIHRSLLRIAAGYEFYSCLTCFFVSSCLLCWKFLSAQCEIFLACSVPALDVLVKISGLTLKFLLDKNGFVWYICNHIGDASFISPRSLNFFFGDIDFKCRDCR